MFMFLCLFVSYHCLFIFSPKSFFFVFVCLWFNVHRAPGMVSIVVSWLITFYSFWQLIQPHEPVPGKRFYRYHELGQHRFGPNLGYCIIMPQQMIGQVVSSVVYSVTGRKSLKKFFDVVVPSMSCVGQTYYILFFTCFQFPKLQFLEVSFSHGSHYVLRVRI